MVRAASDVFRRLDCRVGDRTWIVVALAVVEQVRAVEVVDVESLGDAAGGGVDLALDIGGNGGWNAAGETGGYCAGRFVRDCCAQH